MSVASVGLPAYVRQFRDDALGRTLTLVNDKGGVGKTTMTTNLLGQLSGAGYRVLGVDLNRQANMSDDLGYRGAAFDDQGEQLYEAIRRGPGRLTLQAHEVRPGLWVVPGGKALTGLPALITTQMMESGNSEPYLGLAAALAPIAGDYDLVIVDSPPENTTLVDLALAAAKYVVMPTKSDTGGVVGMSLVAERFQKAKALNPGLTLLGVILFATGTNATAIHAEVRADVQEAFGGLNPMLAGTVRHSERVARDMRKLGRLAHELEIDAANAPAFWKALREGKKPGRRFSASTASVAGDFQRIAVEILDLIGTSESQPVEGTGA